jgi:hypothetical protein
MGWGELSMSSHALADELNEVTATAPCPPQRVRGKRRPALLVALSIIGALALAQLLHTYSGSAKWEYVTQQKGITVYSMKMPGVNPKKFLAVFRLRATLNQIVAFMQDDESDVDDVGFYDSVVLKEQSKLLRWTAWKVRLSRPLSDRQFVVKHTFAQDPKTKEVLYTLDATPDLIPQDNCCVRVQRMANSWRLVPLSDGEVEVRWVIDVDVGGWVPYFVMDRHFTWEMFDFASSLQEIVSRSKYIGARTGWVEELH